MSTESRGDVGVEQVQGGASVQDEPGPKVGVVCDGIEQFEQTLDLLDDERVESRRDVEDRPGHDRIQSSYGSPAGT